MLSTQVNGVFVLHKPVGCTSNYCLQRIKHELAQKKIGHAGTLDPMVDGVLLVLLGYGTKISQYLLQEGHKTYKGTLCFGYETDTWDKEGTVLCTASYDHITESMLADAMLAWTTIVEQDVPPISAAKYQGKALYKLARMGHTVPSKRKTVTITSVSILAVAMPYVTFRVTCSSGTYIRSLAHSLGKRLHSVAVLTELTREFSYPFTLADATPLATLLEEPQLLQDRLRSLADALPTWKIIPLQESEFMAVQHGSQIPVRTHVVADTKAILTFANREVALAMFDTLTSCWKILRGL